MQEIDVTSIFPSLKEFLCKSSVLFAVFHQEFGLPLTLENTESSEAFEAAIQNAAEKVRHSKRSLIQIKQIFYDPKLLRVISVPTIGQVNGCEKSDDNSKFKTPVEEQAGQIQTAESSAKELNYWMATPDDIKLGVVPGFALGTLGKLTFTPNENEQRYFLPDDVCNYRKLKPQAWLVLSYLILSSLMEKKDSRG